MHQTSSFSRKEVIQPQVPLRLPCYDFTPVMKHTVVSGLLTVTLPTSGIPHSHGVTGGVYKTMWENTGISYTDLISELLTLAMERPLGLR